MLEFSSDWCGLSIKRPWIDMILSGQKTIEIREWQYAPTLRGPLLLHRARGIDWKTMEFLRLDPPSQRQRGAFVGYAEIADVIALSAELNWRKYLMRHRVIHPPLGDKIVVGLVLTNVRAFFRAVPAAGKLNFFPIPFPAREALAKQLLLIGKDPGSASAQTAG